MYMHIYIYSQSNPFPHLALAPGLLTQLYIHNFSIVSQSSHIFPPNLAPRHGDHRHRRSRRLVWHVLGRGDAQGLRGFEAEGAAQVDEANLRRGSWENGMLGIYDTLMINGI